MASSEAAPAPRAELLRERLIAPSILSADFARLGSQVAEVMDAGARVIHVDVMDGHFVPPITMGALAVSALADQVHDAGGFLDVHLMIEWPERHVEEFARAGADGITIHVEATPHVHYALRLVRDAGCTAGAAVCPATPAGALDEVAHDSLDLALCMSVNPGWGAQELIPASFSKLERMREALPEWVALEVDGGVHRGTVGDCVKAGANLLVTGSAVFGSADPARAYAEIAAAGGIG
ncbi:MAG: ribulose-phosphate 3-epimerase [Solirubrobacterales bacterium]|nr:ribulose-phosphate 3-epimerase [Solirubrobacterales bacterium]